MHAYLLTYLLTPWHYSPDGHKPSCMLMHTYINMHRKEAETIAAHYQFNISYLFSCTESTNYDHHSIKQLSIVNLISQPTTTHTTQFPNMTWQRRLYWFQKDSKYMFTVTDLVRIIYTFSRPLQFYTLILDLTVSLLQFLNYEVLMNCLITYSAALWRMMDTLPAAHSDQHYWPSYWVSSILHTTEVSKTKTKIRKAKISKIMKELCYIR
jgi:hypothetical protein